MVAAAVRKETHLEQPKEQQTRLRKKLTKRKQIVSLWEEIDQTETDRFPLGRN
jgi:hypothetical protein